MGPSLPVTQFLIVHARNQRLSTLPYTLRGDNSIREPRRLKVQRMFQLETMIEMIKLAIQSLLNW